MTFASELEAAKPTYPFDRWLQSTELGFEQYTNENCEKVRKLFDTLIADLILLGPNAPESDKLKKFETIVLTLNDLNEELYHCLIETGEREELCALCNTICKAARMDPSKYGDGVGPASNWRDW